MSRLLIAAALLSSACSVPSPTAPTHPVQPDGATRLELSAAPGIGAQGGTAVLTARVLDGHAGLVPGAVVAWATDRGTLSSTSGETDASGVARAVLTAPVGLASVTASTGTASAAIMVQVQPVAVPPTPTPTPSPAPDAQGQLAVSITAQGGNEQQPSNFVATVTNAVVPFGYRWSFGDGASAEGGPFMSHQYLSRGTYLASLTVSDGAGRSASASIPVVVSAFVPPPPVPGTYTVSVAASPTTVKVGEGVLLTVTATPKQGARPPTAFVYDCNGDGIIEATTGGNTMACNYTTAGVVTAYVTVSDGFSSGRGSVTLTVTP